MPTAIFGSIETREAQKSQIHAYYKAKFRETNDFYDRMLKADPFEGPYFISDEESEENRARAIQDLDGRYGRAICELNREIEREEEHDREREEEWYIERYGRVLLSFQVGMPYRLYLDTHRWRVIRSMVFERDGCRCRYCQSAEKLQAHHLTYKHLYFEMLHLDDLVTVCETCHAKIHRAPNAGN